jgi:hypothetical protein
MSTSWECPSCHQVFAPGTAKCDQCGKSGGSLVFDLTREYEIHISRDGKSERYHIGGVGGKVLYGELIGEQYPAPPPAYVYILYKRDGRISPTGMIDVYATQDKAKDSAHYWARSERQEWAALIERSMTWEQTDVPLEWRRMMTADCRNWSSSVCARAGTARFVIDVHKVNDGPLRHTGEKS